MDWQRKKVQKLKKLTPDKIRDFLESRFIQHEAPIVRRIEKDSQGHRAIRDIQRARGASGRADILAKEAKEKIFESVKHDEEAIFEGLLQAHRTIEVENLFKKKKSELKAKAKSQQELELYNEDADIMSPGGLTSKEAQAYIDEVKAQNPEMFARHEQAMNRYWDTMAKQIKELHTEGLIDKGLQDFLLKNHRNYSPRLFLQHMDPESTGMSVGGRRVNVTDSGD